MGKFIIEEIKEKRKEMKMKQITNRGMDIWWCMCVSERDKLVISQGAVIGELMATHSSPMSSLFPFVSSYSLSLPFYPN